MTKWEGKTRGGLTGYKIFVFLIKTFGISFAYFFVYLVAFYFLFFSGKAYKAIFYYFNKALKFNKLTSFRKTYLNFCALGKALVDKIAILSGLKRKYTFDYEGEQHLRQMVADGSGGILINAHVGNWEIAGQLLERLETRIHILMFDAEHRQISSYLKEILTERNMHIIVIKEDMSHLNEIGDALSNKELIAMGGDRYIKGNKVYKVSFFGEDAYFPAGPFSIAARFNVPVTFAFAMKEGRRHYHFYATPPTRVKGFKSIPERESNIREMVESFVAELERKLRMYPLQWFNYFQFWNPLP